MKSLAYIPASDGSGDASLMTITQVRTAPATSITVNTVAGVPRKFFGTMGTPHTFNDPVTGETITIISEATAVNFAGHIDSGKVEIDAIAPGETDIGSKVGDIIVIRPTTQWANNLHDVLAESLNDDGSLKAKSVKASNIDFNTFPLVAPSLMIPTVVNAKEVPIGKVEVSEGVFRTLYFMRWQTSIANAQVQAFDPPYPAGYPEQIVYCIVKKGDGIGGPVLPWGNSVGNWARYSDSTTNNRIIMVKDSAGSWSGALVQVLLWYYKAS